MPKQPQRFKQGDVARALKAAKSAGLSVSRVEIEPNGKLCVMIGDGARVEPVDTPFDSWKQRQQNARPS